MMKKILCTLVVLAIFAPGMLSAQSATSPDTVCVGATENYKIGSPAAGSSFVWGIKKLGGNVVAGQNSGSVDVKWLATPGTDTLWVVETNTGGCVGDTVRLAVVRFAKPTASITGSAQLCSSNAGSAITITCTGLAPYTLEYKKNSTTLTQKISTGNTYTIPATPLAATVVYELVKLTDKTGCSSTGGGTATLTILPALGVLQILHQ